MFTLIAMGTGVAWVYSVVATVFPGLFPAAFRGARRRGAGLFRGGRRHHRARAARARCSSCRRASRPAAPSARCSTSRRRRARRIDADGSDEEVAARRSAGRRPAARASRRERAGRRRGARRAQLGRRVHGHRRVHAGRPRRSAPRSIGGTMNQTGSFVMRADKVGRDTMLAQIVQMVAEAQRSRAPIQRLADQVSGWFVPPVIAVAVLAFLAWSIWGPEPRLAYGAGRRGVGAHHRLPLRAGPGHAHVDHGGRRPRRAGRRAHQERRGAGAPREGRHPRRRQDRHADRRQAQGGGRPDRVRGRRRTSCCGCRQPRARQRASARPPRSSQAAERARLALGRLQEFDCADRQGRHRHGRGPARSSSATGGSWRKLGIDCRARCDAEAESLRQDGATVVFVAIDGEAGRR